jgi:hypothetical protein
MFVCKTLALHTWPPAEKCVRANTTIVATTSDTTTALPTTIHAGAVRAYGTLGLAGGAVDARTSR